MEAISGLFSLKDRYALIPGGTGGLGKGIAQAFLEAGAHVAVCGNHPEKGDVLIPYAKKYDRQFLSIACDITNPDAVNAMLDDLAEKWGRIDLLVNCAGINQLKLAEDYDDETFEKVMRLNMLSLHSLTREVGKRFMIPQQYGKIVNLSSVKSIIGTTENYAAYCASKGAVNMYTKQIACEWGKYHINCNAIAPTFVRTPINSFQLDDPVFYKKLTDRIPLGRIGKEEDIAAAALYLCSDAAAFVSGQVLCVDGGLTAMQ